MSDFAANIVIFIIAICSFMVGALSGKGDLTDELQQECLIAETITLNDIEFECHLSKDNTDD